MNSRESWIIGLGVLLWIGLISASLFFLLRALRRVRSRNMLLDAEEEEARLVAARFAAMDYRDSDLETPSMDSLTYGLVSDSNGILRTMLQRGRATERSLLPPPRLAPDFEMAPSEGLTKYEINAYAPVVEGNKALMYEEEDEHMSKEDVASCAICLDEIESGSRQRVLPCRHTFHPQCIRIWLSKANRCPCCQAAVAKKRISPPTYVPPVADIYDPARRGVPHFSTPGSLPSRRLQRAVEPPRSRFFGAWMFAASFQRRHAAAARNSSDLSLDDLSIDERNSNVLLGLQDAFNMAPGEEMNAGEDDEPELLVPPALQLALERFTQLDAMASSPDA